MRLGASAIILKDKKILLVKRSKDSDTFPEKWACPGGRDEPGESPEEVVIREIKEEVNLEFTPSKLFKIWVYKGLKRYRFLGSFKGQVKLQKEELTEWNWFSYDEAIKLDLGFDYRELLERLHEEEFI